MAADASAWASDNAIKLQLAKTYHNKTNTDLAAAGRPIITWDGLNPADQTAKLAATASLITDVIALVAALP